MNSNTTSCSEGGDVSTTGAGFLDPRDEIPERRQELRAWMQLQASLALEPELARMCLQEAGEPRAALRRSGVPPAWSPGQLEAAIRVVARRGTLALPLLSSAYPNRLAALPDPSPLLWVEGDVRVLTGRSVAIVGARAATAYGLGVARELAAGLAKTGLVVVSGLARGVDGAAHRAALEAGGHTLAVQACGPDRVYPPEHRGLADEIRASGAILSEMPPGTPPRAPYFPLRNRLISAVSELVVVVEARERSGSLITARHAAGRQEVGAVPGPITSPTSRGPNRLIKDGALTVLGVESILHELGISAPVSGDRSSSGGGGRGGCPVQREILAALRHQPATRDELARRLGKAPEQLALQLVDLELEERVGVDRDGRLVVKTAKSRRGPVRKGREGHPGDGSRS